MPLRFNRSEVRLGNFSYQGVALAQARRTLEQANADIARMLPMASGKFPPPSGFSVPKCSKRRVSVPICGS
jgi:hypothetical protein